MMLLVWNRHGSGRPALPRTDRHTEKTQGPLSPAGVFTPSNPPSRPQAPDPDAAQGQAPGPSASLPPPDYESEDFTHVPDWIPRPLHAVSAVAEDASLRSDGFVEGTLRFTFGSDQTDALEEITAHLEAAGMIPDADGTVFSVENPPRRCEIRVETAPNGGMMVSLIYQGIDHEKGCLCPTCGGSPEPSNQ